MSRRQQYVYGNLAEKAIYKESPELQHIIKKRKHKKSQKRLLMCITIFALLFGLIIFRSINMIQLNNELLTEQEKYNALLDQNARMTVKVNNKLNDNQIRTIAQQRLGMKVPTETQKIYIHVNRGNLTLTASDLEKGEENNQKGFLSGLIEKIKAIVGLH